MEKQSYRLSRISDQALLFILAAAWFLMHCLFNGNYGLHRDELDILMNARQLDWGYVAYPPLTPLIARISLELFGTWQVGLRLFPALASALVFLLVAGMARDMGGKRLAQIAAGLGAVIAPVALMAGTLIQYMSFDFLWWVASGYCLVRLLKTGNPRWWLGLGAALGLGMLTKYTLVFYIAGLVVGVLLSPLRRDLRSRWLWAGAGLALLIFLPNLVWQVQNNFISLEFLNFIHARDIQWGRTKDFIPLQFYESSNPFLLPLWITGLVVLLIPSRVSRFRPLAVAFLTAFGLLLASQGRSYYLAPAFVPLYAAGAAWLEGWIENLAQLPRRAVLGVASLLYLLGLVVGVILIKPAAPPGSDLFKTTIEINGEAREMFGWHELVDQVADIYAKLPEADKPRAAILTGNYGEAGALDLYGRSYNLPRIISGANSLWARGYGSPEPETVIVVGFEPSEASRVFRTCQAVGIVSNQYNIRNEESRFHTSIFICRDIRKPWAETWKDMHWFQ